MNLTENRMNITKNTVVGIHYKLTNDDGDVLDSSEGRDPLMYLHGAQNIVIGLEKALENKSIGDQVQVSVSPEEGYGLRREELTQEVPSSAFEGVDELSVGMQFHAETDRGPVPITIVEINGDSVTIDGNHALAGVTLHFDVTIDSVREASEEEVSHGHVH